MRRPAVIGARVWVAVAAIALGLALVGTCAPLQADAPLPGWPLDAQSTTGPFVPQGVGGGAGGAAISSPQVISGVPAYLWHHGCGPTAAGMVIGYWDGQGFGDLVPGDATTQTASVDTMVASTENYSDYCLPLDSSPGAIQPDLSEPPVGDEHQDNCVADFMYTSHSYQSNYYGWSWYSHVGSALASYSEMQNSSYQTTTQNLYWGSGLTWGTYCAEIDAGRPLVLLVDTDANGYTDHFVTAIGYGYEDSSQMYACLNTWDGTIHWYAFAGMANGQPWGIYGGIAVQPLAWPMPKVVLEDHPNERAPGAASSTLLGKTPWVNPVIAPTAAYWWQTYRFAGSGALWIQVCAQNFSSAQNGYNDGDDLRLTIDGVVPSDYDGIQKGALGSYQWNGNLEKGERWTLRFLALNQGGLHNLRLSADQAPILWWIKVTDLEPAMIYPD